MFLLLQQASASEGLRDAGGLEGRRYVEDFAEGKALLSLER
jgi:hypothetical protein